MKKNRLPELYRIRSILNEIPFGGGRFDGVPFDWAVERSDPLEIDAPACIEYMEADDNRYHFLQESFTVEESKAFVEWLTKNRSILEADIKVFRVEIPIRRGTKPTRCFGEGDGYGCLRISIYEDFNLPFDVLGYYSVRHLVPVVKPQEINWLPGLEIEHQYGEKGQYEGYTVNWGSQTKLIGCL